MLKILKRLSIIFQFSLFLSLFSCATSRPVDLSKNLASGQNLYLPSESEIVWQKIENLDWAEYFFFENADYPVRYHCVKINLSDKNLSIVTFPSSENDFSHKSGKKMNYFTGLTADEFADITNSKIIVNTAPFGGKNGKWDLIARLTSTRRICGVHIAEKKLLSEPIERYSAICFQKNQDRKGYTAKIFKNQKNEDFTDCDFAFGGFFQILSKSKKIETFAKINDSRTAIGISADGKTLYLLVVEGEKRKVSKGLSYPECADIFLKLGASEALQMDGGGSSTLFINGKTVISYPTNRKCAVFLGFACY